MCRVVLGAAVCVTLASLTIESVAAAVGYKFSGSVTSRAADPYGKPIPLGAAVTGRFVFDNASPATHNLTSCGDCIGYEQRTVNGFEAWFGSVLVRADDYVVVIANDTPVNPFNPQQGTHDVFTIEFLSSLNPPPADPLFVGGDSQTVGRFSISMSTDSSTFPSSSLPGQIDPVAFPQSGRVGILSHSAVGVPDIGFSIVDLSAYAVTLGDYNFDEVLDAGDYEVWRNTFGAGINGQLDADGNRSRTVDAADYVIWRRLATSSTASGLHALPEPSSAFMLALLGLMKLVWRKK